MLKLLTDNPGLITNYAEIAYLMNVEKENNLDVILETIESTSQEVQLINSLA